MHGCFVNGTDMPGHTDCLPDYLTYSKNEAPLIQTLETRGGDVKIPIDTLLK